MARIASPYDGVRYEDGAGNEISENYLASVSDMMSGLIFFFILVLLVFVINYRQATGELTDTLEVRDEILFQIRALLERDGVRVQVGEGLLRLPESILFPLGSAELTAEGQRALRSLARALSTVLPCYVGGRDDPLPPGCPAGARRGKLDAVFIEGHTDSLPLRDNALYADNWELSTARARRTYQALVTVAPELDRLRNFAGQPLLSIAGYADRRPVAPNDTDANRQLNRRIDVRLIMASPTLAEVPTRERPSLPPSTGPGGSSDGG